MFQQKLFSLGGFHLKSARFHLKSAGFHLKSARFHEIQQISYGFHEIQQISCEIHPEPYKFRCFSKNSSVWVDFTWNLPDFMKSAGFHMDFMKSSGFHVKSKDLLQGIVTLCFPRLDGSFRNKVAFRRCCIRGQQGQVEWSVGSFISCLVSLEAAHICSNIAWTALKYSCNKFY